MKKISLIVASMLIVASSSLFAKPPRDGKFDNEITHKCGNFNKGHDIHKKHGSFGGDTMKDLNLTSEQKHNMSILRDEMKLEMKKISKPDDFSNGKFDKNEYIKNSKEFYNKKVEIEANYIEKLYNLLTKEQQALFFEKKINK